MLADTTPANDRWAHDHITRSQTCPMCFGAVARQNIRENRGAMLADFACEMGHVWFVRWPLAQVIA